MTLKPHNNCSDSSSSLAESCGAMAFLLTRCWGAGWTDGETGEFIPANNWKPLLSANTVIWITAFTGWNISTGFRFSNSLLKLLSLPHCLPVSLLLPPPLSSCFHRCCAVSLPPADERIGSWIVPPCWVIGICLLLFLLCIEAVPAAPLCVYACVYVCVYRVLLD